MHILCSLNVNSSPHFSVHTVAPCRNTDLPVQAAARFKVRFQAFAKKPLKFCGPMTWKS